MKTLKKLFTNHHFMLQTIGCMALTFATISANARCVYIFHNPKKPDALKQLRNF